MSFFDEIDMSPRCLPVTVRGKGATTVTRYVHEVTHAEILKAQNDSQRMLDGLPEVRADQLWKARCLVVAVLESADPNSDPVFAGTDLERVAGLPMSMFSALWDAFETLNTPQDLKKKSADQASAPLADSPKDSTGPT